MSSTPEVVRLVRVVREHPTAPSKRAAISHSGSNNELYTKAWEDASDEHQWFYLRRDEEFKWRLLPYNLVKPIGIKKAFQKYSMCYSKPNSNIKDGINEVSKYLPHVLAGVVKDYASSPPKFDGVEDITLDVGVCLHRASADYSDLIYLVMQDINAPKIVIVHGDNGEIAGALTFTEERLTFKADWRMSKWEFIGVNETMIHQTEKQLPISETGKRKRKTRHDVIKEAPKKQLKQEDVDALLKQEDVDALTKKRLTRIMKHLA